MNKFYKRYIDDMSKLILVFNSFSVGKNQNLRLVQLRQVQFQKSRRLNKCIHDNLLYMLTNLSYTSDETRFLEKCIQWYQKKLNSSAISKSEMMRNLSQENDKNMKTSRRKIVISDEYYKRTFMSPEMYERFTKGARTHRRSMEHINRADRLLTSKHEVLTSVTFLFSEC